MVVGTCRNLCISIVNTCTHTHIHAQTLPVSTAAGGGAGHAENGAIQVLGVVVALGVVAA